MRRTKIVATVGPASSTEAVLDQLIAAGATVFRLNFSHGSHEDHSKTVGLIRSSTYDRYFTELFPGVQISRYENYETLLLDLVSGRVDAIMAGPIKMEGFFAEPQGKNFKYIGPELENIKYFGPGVGVGLRKNEPELLDKVNNALKGMFADGTFTLDSPAAVEALTA